MEAEFSEAGWGRGVKYQEEEGEGEENQGLFLSETVKEGSFPALSTYPGHYPSNPACLLGQLWLAQQQEADKHRREFHLIWAFPNQI